MIVGDAGLLTIKRTMKRRAGKELRYSSIPLFPLLK
jgi:hypothetical protein